MKLFRINSTLTTIRALVGWPLLALGLYMTGALAGSYIPSNNDWRQPSEGIDIFVESNGVHVSLIVPMAAADEDLSDVIRPDQLSNHELFGTHAMIGWGDGAVYRNAETWGDVKGSDIASAVFGSDDTVLHVYHLIDPQPSQHRKKLRISAAQFHSIIAQIRQTFQLDKRHQSNAHFAYGPDNLFYDATGHYNAFNTCNTWTGRVLKKAGIRVGVWTPLPGGVMRWF